ncbi:MAG TPA: hypothetical protein VF152_00270 [Acidimicrobiia bacterium]
MSDADADRPDDLDRSQRPGPLRVETALGRGSVERTPVPGRPTGAGQQDDRFGERTLRIPLAAAIAMVATIVVGQLWALTVALDAWLGGDEAAARWIVVFQAASFGLALLLWRATPRTR